MTKITATAISALTAVLFSGSAYATDLGSSLKDDRNYVSSGNSATWTGFFAGGMLGGTFNSTKLDYADYHDSVLPCTDLDLGASVNGLSTVGVHAGGIVGYQRQLGNLVVGVEGWGGWSNADTDVSLGATVLSDHDGNNANNTPIAGGSITAGFKQDYWYAAYAKAGYNLNGTLFSALLGYRAAHVEGTGALDGWDDDLGGISGGLMIEKMVTTNFVLGGYAVLTAFEEKKYPLGEVGGIKAETLGVDVGVRGVFKF